MLPFKSVDDFKAASKHNETPSAFFAFLESGEHNFSFSYTENIWHTNFITT